MPAKPTWEGDFRQATYRAVRQGNNRTSQLLEPWYSFRLEVPAGIGRAITDIQRREGTFDPPETGLETAVLTGTAPVATLRDYPVAGYTHGRGRIA